MSIKNWFLGWTIPFISIFISTFIIKAIFPSITYDQAVLYSLIGVVCSHYADDYKERHEL